MLFKDFSVYSYAEIPKNTAEEKQCFLIFLLTLFQAFYSCDVSLKHRDSLK